jgi:hypothetical protein
MVSTMAGKEAQMNSMRWIKGLKDLRGKHNPFILAPLILVLICSFFIRWPATVAYAQGFAVAPTGTEMTVNYDEPTTNANGTPLTDLKEIKIFYNMGAGAVEGKTIPASQPTGGQHVVTKFTVPVAENQETDVDFWGTAYDTSGNASAESDHVVKRIDRLAPCALGKVCP